MSSLILKFRTHLRPHIFEKMITLRFNSLVDCYVAALQVETSLDMRSAERARARGHSGTDSRKITHHNGVGGWQGYGHQSGGSSLSSGSGGRGRFSPYGYFQCGQQGHRRNECLLRPQQISHLSSGGTHNQSGSALFQSLPRQTQSRQSGFTTPHQTQQQYPHQYSSSSVCLLGLYTRTSGTIWEPGLLPCFMFRS